jgi:hypothetical protein
MAISSKLGDRRAHFGRERRPGRDIVTRHSQVFPVPVATEVGESQMKSTPDGGGAFSTHPFGGSNDAPIDDATPSIIDKTTAIIFQAFDGVRT